jgi:pantothenate kinase
MNENLNQVLISDVDLDEFTLSPDAFKNLQNANRLGIDIGGSLVKIVYSSSFECKTAHFYEDNSELIYSVNERKKTIQTLNFIKFETKYIEQSLEYLGEVLRSSKVLHR